MLRTTHCLRFAERWAGWASLPFHPRARRSLTLVELLVVMSIMMLLIVVAVPRMRPGLEARRIRESARAVNVYLNAARNRAIQNVRAWGVAIVRDQNSPYSGITLMQVEVPTPYGGETEDSRFVITPANTIQFWSDPAGVTLEDPVTPGLVKVGDSLQLGYQGHIWYITSISQVAPNTWSMTFASTTTTADPSAPSASGGRRFQVFRQPVTSSAAPLQLPRNVAIDLRYSGTDSAVFAGPGTLANSLPYPRIMFSSTGAVDQIASDTIATTRVTQPVYLLVGRRDRVNPVPTDLVTYQYQTVASGPTITVTESRPVAEDGLPNFRDQTNLWVAVNPQTGYIVCSELSPATSVTNYAGAPVRDTTNTYLLFDPAATRTFAREFQAIGGR